MSFYKIALTMGMVLVTLLTSVIVVVTNNITLLHSIDLSDLILGGLVVYVMILLFYSGSIVHLRKKQEQSPAATSAAHAVADNILAASTISDDNNVQHNVRNTMSEILVAAELLFVPKQSATLLKSGTSFYTLLDNAMQLIEQSYSMQSSGSLQDIKSQLVELRKRCVDTSISLMIVEDNPMNLHVSQMLFKKIGCVQIYAATGGKDALSQLANIAQPPDLIVIDHLMPEMDGCQTADAIHQFYSTQQKTPPIMLGLTGSFSNELQQKSQNHHIKKLFSKPLTLAKVVDMIELCSQPEQSNQPLSADELATQVIGGINGTSTPVDISDIRIVRQKFEQQINTLKSISLSDEQQTYLQILNHSGLELLDILYKAENNTSTLKAAA